MAGMNADRPVGGGAPQRAPATPPPLTGATLALGTVALSLATFMNVLDTSIANVSLPAIAGDLGVSPDQGTWVITSFGVANAISLPLTGWLTQRYGQVRLFARSLDGNDRSAAFVRGDDGLHSRVGLLVPDVEDGSLVGRLALRELREPRAFALPRVDFGFHGQADLQRMRGEFLRIELDAHGDALHDLDPVARRVLRGQ